MPLPTSINDLSTTVASNSPAGSENPQTFDDYLRWHASFIAALRDVVLSGTANLSTANITYTGTLTGSTGILNIGSGQLYKNGSGSVGIGTSSPASKLEVSGSAAITRITGTAGTAPRLELSSAGVVNWSLRSNNGSASELSIYQDSTQRFTFDSSGNFAILNTSGAPSAPAGGGVLYVQAGALKYIGSSGTITTIAAA